MNVKLFWNMKAFFILSRKMNPFEQFDTKLKIIREMFQKLGYLLGCQIKKFHELSMNFLICHHGRIS